MGASETSINLTAKVLSYKSEALGEYVRIERKETPRNNPKDKSFKWTIINPKKVYDLLREDSQAINNEIVVNYYVGINPIKEERLRGEVGNFGQWQEKRRGKGISENDIERREWLFFDFDAVKAPNTMATDLQRAAAIERGESCRDLLMDEGWNIPIQSDSGNGYHLLFRVTDWKIEDEPTIEELYKILKSRFSDDIVEFDSSVADLCRITRLYGTENRKGMDSQLYRKSLLLDGRMEKNVATTMLVVRAFVEKYKIAENPSPEDLFTNNQEEPEEDLPLYKPKMDVPSLDVVESLVDKIIATGVLRSNNRGEWVGMAAAFNAAYDVHNSRVQSVWQKFCGIYERDADPVEDMRVLLADYGHYSGVQMTMASLFAIGKEYGVGAKTERPNGPGLFSDVTIAEWRYSPFASRCAISLIGIPPERPNVARLVVDSLLSGCGLFSKADCKSMYVGMTESEYQLNQRFGESVYCVSCRELDSESKFRHLQKEVSLYNPDLVVIDNAAWLLKSTTDFAQYAPLLNGLLNLSANRAVVLLVEQNKSAEFKDNLGASLKGMSVASLQIIPKGDNKGTIRFEPSDGTPQRCGYIITPENGKLVLREQKEEVAEKQSRPYDRAVKRMMRDGVGLCASDFGKLCASLLRRKYKSEMSSWAKDAARSGWLFRHSDGLYYPCRHECKR